jgi:hypothetical protein
MAKKRGMAIMMIVLIVLGIAVLTFLIFGFSTGWSNLWDRVTSFGGGVGVDTAKKGCELACGSNSVYEYCENVFEIEFEDEEVVSGTCKDFEGDKRVGLEVCGIVCNERGEDDGSDNSPRDVSVEEDSGSDGGGGGGSTPVGEKSAPSSVVIKGRAVDAISGEPLGSVLKGVNLAQGLEGAGSSADSGEFDISLGIEEGVWWLDSYCHSHLIYGPNQGYIVIEDLDAEGFNFRAGGFEQRYSFSEFGDDGRLVVNLNDFTIYPVWSVRARSSVGRVLFNIMYKTKDGFVEGFPHGEFSSGIIKPYSLPVSHVFYVRVVEEDGGDVYDSGERTISSELIDCGLLDVEYLGDGDFFWELDEHRHYWIEEEAGV